MNTGSSRVGLLLHSLYSEVLEYFITILLWERTKANVLLIDECDARYRHLLTLSNSSAGCTETKMVLSKNCIVGKWPASHRLRFSFLNSENFTIPKVDLILNYHFYVYKRSFWLYLRHTFNFIISVMHFAFPSSK